MIKPSIHSLILHSRGKADQAALHDRQAVFWVDWREDSAEIPNLCELVLCTGALGGDWIEDKAVVNWRGVTTLIPITETHDDPHLALLALNAAFAPDYEVRFVRQSVGNDGGAFVPLASAEWASLESQYGAPKVAEAFARIQQHPNLFTETAPAPPAWWRFW
jgi:hypothetical protein